MHAQMPQEIEVWYIIPALRREIAKSMIHDHNLNQKQIAELMGLTEAAVSQYINSKRAKEVDFSDSVLEEIKNSAQRIIESPNYLLQEMIRLTKLTEVRYVLCDTHRKHDSTIAEDCEVCFEEDLIKIQG